LRDNYAAPIIVPSRHWTLIQIAAASHPQRRATVGGKLFNRFGGSGLTGFNLDTVYSTGIAAIGRRLYLPRLR
jgi:hypothetical protein